MKYNTFTLDNGLRIIHHTSTSDVVYCGYQINVGTRNELASQEGLAHFCEHGCFKGTQKRKAWHISNALERVGGDLNAFTNKEDTVYYATFLKEHTPKAIDLLTDIVFHSSFPQHELDKEKEVICDEIESYNDSPSELIYDEFENILFPNHPLGHNILGTTESVRAFTSEDALLFTKQYYTPQNSIFFIYGNVRFQRIIDLLKRATSNFPPCSPIIQPIISNKPVTNLSQNIVHNRGTHQAHVMLGCRAYNIHHDKRIALYLLNNILGGPGMSARFNQSLREHHGLVYTVESMMVSYSDEGFWATYFGCDPKDIKKCLRLIRKELDKVIEKPISDTLLARAKKQIKGQIAVSCDNREGFALDFGKSFLHYGWERDVTSLFHQLDKLTTLDLQEVATELMKEEQLTTLIYR